MDPLDGFLLIFMLCFFLTFFIGFIWLVTADHHRRKKYNHHLFTTQQHLDLENDKKKKESISGSAGNYFTFTSVPDTGVLLPRPNYSALYIPTN